MTNRSDQSDSTLDAIPEFHSDEAIEGEPVPPGQAWGVSLGTAETGPGVYRVEVACGPGASSCDGLGTR